MVVSRRAGVALESAGSRRTILKDRAVESLNESGGARALPCVALLRDHVVSFPWRGGGRPGMLRREFRHKAAWGVTARRNCESRCPSRASSSASRRGATPSTASWGAPRRPEPRMLTRRASRGATRAVSQEIEERLSRGPGDAGPADGRSSLPSPIYMLRKQSLAVDALYTCVNGPCWAVRREETGGRCHEQWVWP